MEGLIVVLLVLLILAIWWMCWPESLCKLCKRKRCVCRKRREHQMRAMQNKEPFVVGDYDSSKVVNKTEHSASKPTGLNPGCKGSWHQYLEDTFIEPEVHESQMRYATEAIDRSRNPSKYSVTDNNTGYNIFFTGLSRPRRVPISEDAQLQPDVDINDYRVDDNNESAQGQLMQAYGYVV